MFQKYEDNFDPYSMVLYTWAAENEIIFLYLSGTIAGNIYPLFHPSSDLWCQIEALLSPPSVFPEQLD